MNPMRLAQTISLVLMVVCLVGAGIVQTRLESERVQIDKVSGEELSQSFPELKILQAVPGGIRALAINYLWIRNENLKNDGKYYDAEQVSSMICRLQPRFPGVWGNRAWNLSYNISVQTHTPQERWHWIQAGLELLRDKGLVYNPKSLVLYRELAWIYFHKVGGTSDDMHMFYKRYVAADMHRVLGAPPKVGSVEAAIDWFRPVAEAPATREGLLADEAVAAWVKQLEQWDIGLGQDLLDAYSLYGDDASAKMLGQPAPPAQDERDAALTDLMRSAEYAESRAQAVAFSRRRELEMVYRMQPSWMLQMMEKYGPLDWRLPWSQSLYWATYGVYHVKGVDLRSVDSLNTIRNVLNNLKELAYYGRIALTYNAAEPELPGIRFKPDMRFAMVAHQAYIDQRPFITGEREVEEDEPMVTYEKFASGHLNFISDMIHFLYAGGQEADAESLMRYVRENYRPGDPKWSNDPEAFVMQQILVDGVPRRQKMVGMLQGFIGSAYEYAAMGYYDEAALLLGRAEMFYRKFHEAYEADRLRLGPLADLQAEAALAVIYSMPPEMSMDLWNELPVPVQQRCYDYLKPDYATLVARNGLDFDKAFPEPPGMEQYRQERRARLEQEKLSVGQRSAPQ